MLSIACYDRFSLQAFEVVVQAAPQRAAVGRRRKRLRHDDEVAGRQVRLAAERLASQAFQAITVHGAFRGTARDGEPQARAVAPIGAREHSKKSVARAARVAEDAGVLGTFVQAPQRREPCSGAKQRNAKPADASGREPSASLLATTGKHLAAAASGHSRTKAVGSLAMQIARLECSLHGDLDPRLNERASENKKMSRSGKPRNVRAGGAFCQDAWRGNGGVGAVDNLGSPY